MKKTIVITLLLSHPRSQCQAPHRLRLLVPSQPQAIYSSHQNLNLKPSDASPSSLRPQAMISAPGPNLDLHHVSSKTSLNTTTRPRAPSHLGQTGPPTIQVFQRESNAPPFLKQVAFLPHEVPVAKSLKPQKSAHNLLISITKTSLNNKALISPPSIRSLSLPTIF